MRTRDVEAALHQGASYVGAIMAGGPRNLSLRDAVATLAPARGRAKRVVVVRTGRPEEVADVARQFDVVQLHGDAMPEEVQALRALFPGEIWSVVRSTGSDVPDFLTDLYAVSDAVVLDRKTETGLGGSGEPLDWPALSLTLANGNRGRTVLAGGLRPTSVSDAIAAIRPDVVDVSSGVEIAPGIKDHNLMREFAVAVRGAGTIR